MKALTALHGLMFGLAGLGACADGALAPVDPTDPIGASFLMAAKGDGTGIDPTSLDACSVLAAANGASAAALDDTAGVDARAVKGITAARPFATLDALDAVSYVGPVAFQRLLAFANDNGFRCAAPGGTGTGTGTGSGLGTPACTAVGGTYDGVKFTAKAECKALAYLNGARMSDLRPLPDLARSVAYAHCPAGVPCTGYHFAGWSSLGEFSAWPKIAGAALQAVASASKSWTAPAGPGYDTVADVWTRRSELNGGPVLFEKVYVTKGGITEGGSFPYVCVEVRDAPDAVNYIHACVQTVNADSAPACAQNPGACLAPTVGTWLWMRGTVRKSTAHPGGYKINLMPDGPHAANPALLTPVPGTSAGPLDDAWRAAAIDEAGRLVADGPMPAPVPAATMPAAAKARVEACSQTNEVSVIETYALVIKGHTVYLVLATDGSGEGNLVWVDLIAGGGLGEAGEWFAHAIGHTVWDGGGLSWGLDEEDTTVCVCGDAGSQAVCTWLDGSTQNSGAITCE